MTPLRAVLLTIAAGLSVGLIYVTHQAERGPFTLKSRAAAPADSAELLPPGAEATAEEQPLTFSRLMVVPRAATRPVNIVIAGVTPQYGGPRQRLPENFRGLTDTLLLVQLDSNAKTVRVVGFPRDTKITRPTGGFMKLNAALPSYGPDGLSQVVTDFTGVPVDAYILLGLDATRQLTDTLGGVNIFVPKDMYYDDHAAGLHIRLQRGQQRLNGEQAESFVRFRNDSLGDIGRVQRQQAFMRAALAEVLTPSGLTKLPALGGVLERNTRSNITGEQLAAAFDLLRQRPALESFTLPGTFENSGAASYWATDKRRASELFSRHFTVNSNAGSTSLTDPAALDVVLVDSGAGSEATLRTRELLREQGFNRTRIMRSTASDPGSTVILGQQGKGDLERVRSVLNAGAVRLSGEGVLGADITVWLGTDAR